MTEKYHLLYDSIAKCSHCLPLLGRKRNRLHLENRKTAVNSVQNIREKYRIVKVYNGCAFSLKPYHDSHCTF